MKAMKAYIIIKVLFTLILGLYVLQMPAILFGETNVVDCSSEALRAFFPEKVVLNTLKKFNVPQDKWSAITEALRSKEKDIFPQIEAKAANMNPNPLKDPSFQKVAVSLFKETIFEASLGPFKDNGIGDEKQIQAMLDDIQSQKTQQFQECIKTNKFPFKQEKVLPK